MFKHSRGFLMVALLIAVSGCAMTPSTNIKQPLTAKPVAKPVTMVNDGAIYQPQQGMALFEDRRARHVGDTITVNLVENTQITRNLDNKQNRTGNATVSIPSPTLLGYSNILGASSWSPNAAANSEVKAAVTNNNNITGGITVTVVEVLDNGNLSVTGEKQVSLDNDTQFIRLAGVVNPNDIGVDGTIDSNKLADVKFESKSSTGIDRSTLVSMMARFFVSVLPFSF
jgi:flagellar L-ring protein precursor FlgH